MHIFWFLLISSNRIKSHHINNWRIKNTSNTTHDVEKVEETYKVVDEFYDLDDIIQYEIGVFSYQNKEIIDSDIEGGFHDDDPNFVTNILPDIKS